MTKCVKCGSHAFNLYKEGIDQGGWCDVHYWQGRAHRAEAKQEQLIPSNSTVLEKQDAPTGMLHIDRLGKWLDASLKERKQQQGHCAWKQHDDANMPDTWEADCGAMWTFTEGGPKANDMKFCPNCGKPTIEAAHGVEE